MRLIWGAGGATILKSGTILAFACLECVGARGDFTMLNLGGARMGVVAVQFYIYFFPPQ